MGIEPTQNGISALRTVLKTVGPTRTLPPPTEVSTCNDSMEEPFSKPAPDSGGPNSSTLPGLNPPDWVQPPV